MTYATPKLKLIHERFERTRKAQTSFVLGLNKMCSIKGRRKIPIGKTQRERLCEMAFVVLFTAWEELLEKAFKAIVVDAPLGSFRKHNRVLVVDSETMNSLLRGSKKYVDWADQNSVRERAKVFFKAGEPFESALSSAANDLNSMRVIRNRCVHYSQHANDRYRNLLRNIYGTSTKRPAPGGLLLGTPPTGLSAACRMCDYGSVFELYSEILSTISLQIVEKPRRR